MNPLLEDEDADLSAVAVGGPEPQEAPQACKAPGLALAPAEPEVTPATEPEPSTVPKGASVQSLLIAQFVATYNQHKPQTWPAYHPTGWLTDTSQPRDSRDSHVRPVMSGRS